ncbi:LacI family transcriptional regulator [Hydrogenophaga crassostreae]|uniref:LacI family transcriptional regulator n=1 Tax=Hydrogenophaga crassostreae TaxID=1763535 RepID=A0A167HNS0_9BURK|nr:sugar ABC transporter substrate-binding protein [Hydrogenophaga crassostreae]AOW14939.1 LacI family transcriptional regulator [Hydrogenophaga crassostreae]OAD41506.1 LacI family transcriptional regulator [Hydrogenophaga crassostreae]
MKFTRRTLQASMALSLAGSLFASPSFAADKPKVALVMKSLANEFFRTMEDGAKAHQKAHAADFSLVSNGIKDETDTAAQIKMVEQMITQRVDAIVIAPADSKALVPVLKTAIDKGILVVNIDNQLDKAAQKEKGIQIPFVGPDNRAGAKLVGDFLGKELKAGDKVGILEGVSTTFNAQQRTLGYQDAMKAAGVTVVSVQSGDWEIGKANTVSAGMMREHPDLKALLAGNDSMALGAVAAVKAAGKVAQVQVVGYDNIDAVKPLLKDGRMLATADQFGAKQAVFAIDIALKALNAKTKQADMPELIKTDVVLVTKDSK